MSAVYRANDKPTSCYTVVRNAAIEDPKLSLRALGLLVWLLSRPAGWDTSAERIAAQMREGRDAIRTALRELEDAGYIERTQEVRADHVRGKCRTGVADERDFFSARGFSGGGEEPPAGFPPAGFPQGGKPEGGNPVPFNKKEDTKKEKQEEETTHPQTPSPGEHDGGRVTPSAGRDEGGLAELVTGLGLSGEEWVRFVAWESGERQRKGFTAIRNAVGWARSVGVPELSRLVAEWREQVAAEQAVKIEQERRAAEREAIGAPPPDLLNAADGSPRDLSGVVETVTPRVTKQGRDWCSFVLRCPDGAVLVDLLPAVLAELGAPTPGAAVTVKGRVSRQNDETKVHAYQIEHTRSSFVVDPELVAEFADCEECDPHRYADEQALALVEWAVALGVIDPDRMQYRGVLFDPDDDDPARWTRLADDVAQAHAEYEDHREQAQQRRTT